MEQKIKVLYVDDEIMNLTLFELNFSNKYNVITAEDGLYAMELLEENRDTVVVISDMRMPSMSGVEFIQQAKEKFPDIRYYILTGYDITNKIQEAVESKLILRYFQKPFNFNEIDEAINSATKE